MAEISSSIYQFLNPRDVTPLDPMGAMQQGQRSAFGQMALQEARRQRQVEEQTRALYRQYYGQGGQPGAPQAGMLPPQGAVQETVNTPYSSDLQAMLSQYQQEGADVTPQPGARMLPGAGPQSMPRPAPDSIRGQAPRAPGASPQSLPRAGHGAGVDTSGLVRALYQLDPKAAQAAEKAARESQIGQLEMVGKQSAMVSQVARSILMQDTQQAYEVGVRYLQQAGIPVDHLPAKYDRRLVEHYYGMSTDAETRVKEAQSRLIGTQADLAPRKLELEETQEARLEKQRLLDEDKFTLDTQRYGLQEAENRRKEREAQRTEQEAAQAVPKYTGDSTLNVAIDQEMQAAGLPRGSQPSGAILDKAMQRVQQGKVDVSRSQGEAGALAKPLEGPALQRVNTLMQGEDVVKALQSEFTPEERRKYVGLGGLRMGAQEAQQLLADATAGKADPKFARFAALVALGKQEAFSTAGQALSGHERDVVFGYIPTGREWSSEEFEQKLTLSGQRLPTLIDRELTLSTTPRERLAERRKRGELPSLSPGSPTATTAPLKDFTEADIAEAMRQTKRSRAEVLDLARKTNKYRVPAQ